jgi:hypothetical protein
MLHLPRPAIQGGKPYITAAPGSPELKAYVETLVNRAQKLRTSKVDPSVDNMLKITGDGRKAALDMRLVDPFARPGDSKVSRAVEKIHDVWAAGKEKRLTQLVFCDLSTPNPDRFNVYDETRDKLIAKGIPAKEIAYIHDAASKTPIVVVDLEGTASKTVVYAVSQADFVVIPTQGSQLDTNEASRAIRVVSQSEKLTGRAKPYAVLLTRTSHGTAYPRARPDPYPERINRRRHAGA